MATKGVRTQHPQYMAMSSRWKQCRDAAEGEEAIHAAREEYLPKLAEETDADYAKRLRRTPFFNATWRTIAGLRGMMFRKPATIELPGLLEEYADDIDQAGTDLQTLAQEVVGECLTVGRVALLAEYPQSIGEGVTLAQAQSAGLRPMISMYKAETLINWKTARINNASVLTLAVLCEEAHVGEGEFSHDVEPRYRVLDLTETGVYRQRVYRINDKGEDEQVGEDIYPTMQGRPMTLIPLVVVGVDCVGYDVEVPPLIDLVTTNLHHYSVAADYEHGCHFSGLPSLFISGHYIDPSNPASAKIYIGGPTANCLPQPEAKAYFCEVQSDFRALRQNLEDKKAEMAVLGARMLETQRAGVEAAETAAQHRKGEESQLSAMAQTVSEGIEQALEWMAQWAGIAGEVEYELNRDFVPVAMNAQELTALVGAWQSGAISQQTLFDNLQRGEVIKQGVSFEDEQARIGEQGGLQ